MKTFFNILQTLVGIKNKTYPDEGFKIPEKIDLRDFEKEKMLISFIIGTIYYGIKKCKKNNEYYKNAHYKLKTLKHIYNNIFYTNEFKDLIATFFMNAQRHYYAFTRLARIYKLKKNPYVVTDDLSLNPLEQQHKLTFILLENKSNFLFNINELITIIETSISNSPDFFSEPLWPLNPYNKQPFTTATLYNIYFQLKNSLRVMPMLFHSFFLENFDLNKFSENYEPLIRENSIKKYVFNSPYTVLYSSTISMLNHNIYTRRLDIHTDFPKELLVDIFRPFLFYDYMAMYYIKGTTKIYNAKILLHNKLREFYNYNKLFGRQFIKLTKRNRKIIKREITFNTKHISFYNIANNLQVNTKEISLTENNVLTIIQHLYNYNFQYGEEEDDVALENETVIYDENENNNSNSNIIESNYTNNIFDSDNDIDNDIYENDEIDSIS